MFKQKKLGIIVGIILVSASLLFIFVRKQYVVPILMYHSVAVLPDPNNRLAVSVDTFEKQMSFLKRRHYNVLPLASLIDLIKNNKNIPKKTVCITFDDGYKDVYAHAFPVLKKYNLPATAFIIIDEVGRVDRLSWDEIKNMQDSGLIAFGSHAMGPEPLVNIKSDPELIRQIFDSRRVLAEKIGKEVILFSYPEGKFTPKIRQLVIDAGYKLAVATNPGKDYPSNDLCALKRLRISKNCNNLFIFWVETSGFYTFIKEHRHK